MKIVCDACQAKYSISDDKVQGKVFKIRCKKCSNIIVVRGGAQASEPAPAPQEKDTRVYDYGYEGGGGGGEAAPGDDAVWHLVINQDQVGPMTAGEVQAKFAAGEVDGETFCWREGFADWLPLSQVDTFASLVASGSTTAATSGGGGAAAVSAMFGGGDDMGTARSDPGDLFAAASAGASSARPADDDDGNDLFGSKPAAASAAASSAASTKLRGERNENSVLFSLNNLAQLASNSPAPAPAASSSSSSGHATGAAGGEGSGLIDIRSMASAYLGGQGGAAKPAASAGIGSIDDLPVFGGGGFSEPAVIMPTVARSRDNRILYVMIGAVGLLAIAAVIMVVILLKGNKGTQVAAADTKAMAGDSDKSDKSDKDKDKSDKDKTADTKEGDTASTGSAAPAQGSATPDKAADTAQVAQADKTPPADNKVHNQGVAPQHPATHTDSHPAAGGTHTVAQASPRPTGGGTPPPAPKGPDKAAGGDSGGCDEVSCVLNNYDGACCQKFRKGGGAKPSGGGSPAPSGGNSGAPELDRAMISSAIGAVKGRAMACGDKSSAKGMVKVHVKVAASGAISSVSVSQSPDPALGACVAAAVQKASFPKTASGGSFSYPFPF